MEDLHVTECCPVYNTHLSMPDLNEAKTRALLINPQLERAGWNLSDHSQVQFEVPVKGYDPTPWNGFTDFCLYDDDGSVLAVIEAKRTVRNAREGEQQLRQYVTEIASKQAVPPFGFMTNGLHHFFWEVDLAHPRAIAGFFSPDDLRRLRFIRQHKKTLQDTPINKKIVERAYQHEAIRRVAEAFESVEDVARYSSWRQVPEKHGPPWGSSTFFCKVPTRKRCSLLPIAMFLSSKR
jgi:type I site-specific restriction endonuclease